MLGGCAADGGAAARRARQHEGLPRERYGIDSSRISGSTGPSAPDTAQVPTLEVRASGGSILVTDEAGRRTNSIDVPEDAALEEIPESYGYTDDPNEQTPASVNGHGATVGVPGTPGVHYRVELVSAAGGRDSAIVAMAVGGGPVMRTQVVPYEVAPGGTVRFEIRIGASDYRVGEIVIGR